MAIDIDHLIKKAIGFTESIRRMSQEERQRQPTKLYVDDYNKLRDLVTQLRPDLVDVLPPRVEFDQMGTANRLLCVQRYAEIDGFAEQIFQLLK